MFWVKLCWVLTLLCACIGAIGALGSMAPGMSAPQEAAMAATACAVAIVPYVFTRAVEGLFAKPAEVPLPVYGVQPQSATDAVVL